MKQDDPHIHIDDPYIKEILIKREKLHADGRKLKKRHDELLVEHLKLKRELEGRTAKTSTAM